MSNFDTVHKQIVFSDLSDNEIDILVNSLMAKKSTSRKNGKTVGLSQAEKVFLQCCKENRNSENGEVVCPHCGTTGNLIRPYGFYKGKQRHICRKCGRTFMDTVGTVVYRSKLSVDTWIRLIELVLQGESCRTIARELGIHKATALYNRHRIFSVIKQFANNNDSFPSMAEGDEYYYPLSFKDVKNPMFFLGTLGRMPYTHRSQEQKYEYVEKLGFDEVFMDRLEQNEWIRKGELRQYVGKKRLKSQELFSYAVNRMEQENIFKVLGTLKEHVKKKCGISNQQVCVLTCVDPTKNHYLHPVCVGRIEPKHIQQNLVPHFTKDTILVTDSHRAYRTIADKNKIPLHQIPSGKHKDLTYKEQAYEIISLLAMQAEKIPLFHFKDTKSTIDFKGILNSPQMA